jgi:hypothetical protein
MIVDVRERLEKVPFDPFLIRRPDGHEYPIPARDHAHIHPRGHRVIVFTDEGATVVLGALHINSIVEQPNGE